MSDKDEEIFCYKAYSFDIKSSFPIPELLPIPFSETADVEITVAPIIGSLPGDVYTNDHFQVSEHQFLLDIDQVARYLVENGKSITVEPYEGVTDAEIRLYLLGSAFAALMHQRGLLPLHGSAIIYHNQTILFSGASGTGKSTLAAGFMKKGVQLLADDVCVVTLDEKNRPIVHPGYPQMKLWTDSLRKLGHKTNPSLTKQSKPKKYSLPLQFEFSSRPLELGGIYFITKKVTDQFKLTELAKPEKLVRLKNNIYRNNFLKGMPNNEQPFHLMNIIVDHCFVKLVERPSQGFQLEKLIQMIENDVVQFDTFKH